MAKKQSKTRTAKAETVDQAEAQPEDARLIRDGEEAAAEYTKSTSRARDQIIPMARGLLAARRCYPADQDFGDWLKQSPYRDIHHNDRAALINIGKHEAELTRVIQATDLTSPRLIWESCRAEVMSVYPEDKPAAEQAASNGHATSDITEATPDTTTAVERNPASAPSATQEPAVNGHDTTTTVVDATNGQPSPAPRHTAGWLRTAVKLGVEAIQLFGHLDEGEPLTAVIVREALTDPEREIARLVEAAKALSNLADKLKAALAESDLRTAA